MKHVVIGSRGSDLALWQANFVKAELEKLGCSVTINIIKTQGDIIQHLSFDKLEGKGFFTKEIEAALLNKSIDLAVHSHKDLETNPPEGLIISCVSERANPSDVLLVNLSSVDPAQKWSLKLNATVGTSSVRRKTQVLKYRPDSKIVDIRGNVPTRIDKLRQGNYDAILLAKSGLDRLGLDLSEFKEVVLDPSEFVPAPAQGVLGLQIRSNDNELHSILQSINFPEVQKCISLERKVLNLLEGGCQLPLGVYCNENHELFVSLADNAGKCVFIKYTVTDFSGMAEKVVSDLNKKLSVV